MSESEQAQARKKIGEMTNTPWGYDVGVWLNNCETLLEIVDSQAQKIKELERQLNPDGVYVIFFEDQSKKPEFFGGPGALYGATERHKQLNQMWACHIFSQISNLSRDTISSAQKIAEQAKEIDRLKQKIQGEYGAKAGF